MTRAGPLERQPPIRKTDAWVHQCDAYDWAMEHLQSDYRSVLLGLSMGTGKSKIAVDVIQNLYLKIILVITPVSAVGVWPREFSRHFVGDATVVVLNKGSSSAKVKKAAAALADRNAGDTVVFSIGYESARSAAFSAWALKQKWDIVILDEIHRIKGYNSKISRFAEKLGRRAIYRMGLTGTPMPHSPLDLWSQYRFLDVRIFGYRYVPFRNMYAITHFQFKSQVLKWINQAEMQEKYRKLCIRVLAKDVLDLPPVTHETIPCELNPRARRAYTDLETEMVADLGEAGFEDLIGRAIDGEVVVDNALTKLIRLQQFTCGFIPTEEGKIIDVDNSKLVALRDLILDLGPRVKAAKGFDRGHADRGPICVFTTFVYSLALIRETVEKLGLRYGEISGRRKDITDHGEMPEDIDIMGVQWASGSTGIDLTRSSIGVIHSPTFNGGQFDQALCRQHRPGQTKHVRFFHLTATRTSDERVYAALKKRHTLVNAIMSTEDIKSEG